MLIIAFVVFAVQSLAICSPTAKVEHPGTIIALTKRIDFVDSDGVVVPGRLADSVTATILYVLNRFVAYILLTVYPHSKYLRTLGTFLRNTGEEHPLASGVVGELHENLTTRAVGLDPMTDYSEALWSGSISVGTPLKTYTVQFDTGSSDLFLPGPKCTKNCRGHRVYDPSSSSTSADRFKNFYIEFGDGSNVSGEQYKDTVAISGLKVSTCLGLGILTHHANTS